MTLKFAFESNESTKWIAVLLGSEKFDELSASYIHKEERIMIITPQTEKEKFNWRKLSPRKFVKSISFIVGAIFLLSVLSFVLFPDPFINTLVKSKITNALLRMLTRNIHCSLVKCITVSGRII